MMNLTGAVLDLTARPIAVEKDYGCANKKIRQFTDDDDGCQKAFPMRLLVGRYHLDPILIAAFVASCLEFIVLG